MMIRERRCEPRISADFEVGVETLSGTCVDLCTGGMRLQTEWSPPVGIELNLTLDGIGGGRVLAKVTHWYSDTGEVGLRFLKFDRRAVSELRIYLREHQPTRREETSVARFLPHSPSRKDTVEASSPRIAC